MPPQGELVSNNLNGNTNEESFFDKYIILIVLSSNILATVTFGSIAKFLVSLFEDKTGTLPSLILVLFSWVMFFVLTMLLAILNFRGKRIQIFKGLAYYLMIGGVFFVAISLFFANTPPPSVPY